MTAPSGPAAAANAEAFTTYASGMCLKWVRGECWRIGSLYGSAIDAWYGATRRHPGDRNPPVGAPMFYAGGTYGHIVINVGPTYRMRSTDAPTTGRVSEQDLDWPVHAWNDTYLGWTEDLNGVILPLGTKDEDEMNAEDWDKLRRIVADEVKGNNAAAAERVWTDNINVTSPAGKTEAKDARQVLREVWQRIAKHV